jgi:hypothetical protein
VRPYCRTLEERQQLESLILYLQPFHVSGGVRVAGVLITPALTMRAITLMYTLFLGAHLYER